MDRMIVPAIEEKRDLPKQSHNAEEWLKPTDVKTYDLVALRSTLPSLRESSLLASGSAHLVVIPSTTLYKHKVDFTAHYQPHLIQKRLSSKIFPIGLLSFPEFPWINAFMQWIIFIPYLRELFIYSPKSLFAFVQFIEVYLTDTVAGKLISHADSDSIAGSLLGNYPQLFRRGVASNLFTIFNMLTQTMNRCPKIIWDPNQELSFRSVFANEVIPNDVFVGVVDLSCPFTHMVERQYLSHEKYMCYDLDAFIEIRQSVENQRPKYQAYLKIDGSWVQCADEKISVLKRSTLLDWPLCQAVIYHYRRVF